MSLMIELARAAESVEATTESSDPEVATIGEALSYAGFTIAIVFFVLLLIFLSIKISTGILASVNKAESKAAPATAAAAPAAAAVEDAGEEFSSGTLRLKGCDEKTAAMIMAIVSDNTGIPLSELVFKSITLVDNE